MNLSELFAKHGHTDKVTGHSYGDSYEKWFSPFRGRSINLLELGVCWFGGGSVLAFSEYFPEGTIWGVDWDYANCVPPVFKTSNVKMFKGDLDTEELFEKLNVRKYEIIIHDCRHLFHLQAKDVLKYFPLLTQDGVLVIEDVRRPHVKRLLESLKPLENVSITVHDLKEQRKNRKMDDNILVKIEHELR